MANCSSCGNKLSFFETIKSLGTKRCDQCNVRYDQARHYWSGIIQQTFDQGGVPAELEQAVYRNFQEIRMPSDLGQSVIQQLQYLCNLSEIRWGNVPIIRTDIHLDSDEHAHFEMPATYHKPTKQVRLVPGRLIGTNKKLYFFSNVGNDSMTIDWNNIGKVEDTFIVENMTQKIKSSGRTITRTYQTSERGVRLTVSKGSGGGAYIVPDPFYTKIIIDTLVRLWKRQLVIYQEQKTHGAISQHIRSAVFKRDGGKCVQCGYIGEYIEYDHIIPRSKGGPNTVENIQLLCRKCNLRKGDRL